jgi:hypothetical protein
MNEKLASPLVHPNEKRSRTIRDIEQHPCVANRGKICAITASPILQYFAETRIFSQLWQENHNSNDSHYDHDYLCGICRFVRLRAAVCSIPVLKFGNSLQNNGGAKGMRILTMSGMVVLCAWLPARGQTYTILNEPFPSQATGISGSNIVGYYSPQSNQWSGFLYNVAANTYSTLNDPLATDGTFAYGIDGSNIVGMYAIANTAFGFVYNGSAYTTLIDPLAQATVGGTQARGISGNYIVGNYDAPGAATYSFLYNTTTDAYTTLTDPDGIDTTALGISGSNVVGGYLKTPIPANTASCTTSAPTRTRRSTTR